jgi:predicted esterase
LLGDDTAPNPSVAAHGTGGNETDLIPLGQSLDLTKQNPREVMNDNEILQYFEAADLSDGL